MTYFSFMDYWFLYVVVGSFLGGMVAFIWEELYRSGALVDPGSESAIAKQQRFDILNELEKRLPHANVSKQTAIEIIYKFAASKNEFSLKDLEDQTKVLQNHYLKTIDNDAAYRINFLEKELLQFTPKEALQVLTIINEGLHNAAMYSKANFIFSIASLEDNKLSVITHDNGVGYNRKIIKDGNGINAISKATQELNGTLKLTSTIGNGTVVNVEIPSNPFDR